VPRNGIGRSCKVGKEQIVGLLLALEAFASTSDAEREERMTLVTQALVAALRAVPQLAVSTATDGEGRGVPRVEVRPAGLDAQELANRLRAGSPSVRVDASRARAGVLTLVPTCLAIVDATAIAAAFAEAVR
jgi:D-glucosaminate-6-phosphate ammonia-lyase